MELLYIAGMGLVSPLGASALHTSVAIRAGVSAYQASRYTTALGDAITMAEVPSLLFDECSIPVDTGEGYNEQQDHIIKMAHMAMAQACLNQPVHAPVPLILAMPEHGIPTIEHRLFLENLTDNGGHPINSRLIQILPSGRAAGIHGIDFAFAHLRAYEYSLVGGSDSHSNLARLRELEQANRLLNPGTSNGFAPGEAACFLLLTPHRALAQVRNRHIIALHPPGLAQEPGHLYSEAPFQGAGLDNAFKKALQKQPEGGIQRIYSSMNGENIWAKEYGVARLRNQKYFAPQCRLEHPADAHGDLGAATGTALIALAAEQLHQSPQEQKYLVYSSSDTALRGALLVEKLPAD